MPSTPKSSHPWRNNHCVYGWERLRTMPAADREALKLRYIQLSAGLANHSLTRSELHELDGLRVAFNRINTISKENHSNGTDSHD
jgi:hypothetical protein